MSITKKIHQIATAAEKVRGSTNLLAPPITADEIKNLENSLSVKLPSQLLELLGVANGETPYICQDTPEEYRHNSEQCHNEDPMLFLDFPFYNSRSIAREYNLEREIEDGLGSGSEISVYPSYKVKPLERNPLWIPFAGSQGDFFSIDLDPGGDGIKGQILLQGASAFNNFTISDDLESFLDLIISHYENSRFLNKDFSWTNEIIASFE